MTQSLTPPAWRSILYVPAHVEKYVAKACRGNADAVQLDLEDGVPEDRKAQARAALPDAVRALRDCGKAVLVRINRPLPLAVPDIQAAVSCGADALSLSKTESGEHVRLLEEVVAEAERRRGDGPQTALIGICESARAFTGVHGIAAASPRMIGLMLGGEDFAGDCGAQPDDEVLLLPKQMLVIAARAAKLAPFGYIGSIAGFRDLDAFRAMVRRSRRFGFQGATCIHPSQIDILNEEYGIGQEEIEYAESVVTAYEEAMRQGHGAGTVGGRMIDRPHYERALGVLKKSCR